MSSKKRVTIKSLGMLWRKESPLWFWGEGKVDAAGEHIELRYGNAFKTDWETWTPVARLGKPIGINFSVQWLLQRKIPKNIRMINEAVRELNFYLIQLFKPDPWEYAIYHCQTTSNIYSRIHWAYFPNGTTGDHISSQIVTLSKQEFDETFGDEKPKSKTKRNPK